MMRRDTKRAPILEDIPLKVRREIHKPELRVIYP